VIERHAVGAGCSGRALPKSRLKLQMVRDSAGSSSCRAVKVGPQIELTAGSRVKGLTGLMRRNAPLRSWRILKGFALRSSRRCCCWLAGLLMLLAIWSA